MDTATSAAVFATAAASTTWTPTNLGLSTEVTHDFYRWTVRIPPAELGTWGEEVPARARIVGRSGYGGTEHLDVEANWGQTACIVDAAMRAVRER
jgi:Tfp pilus assembly protein PilV